MDEWRRRRRVMDVEWVQSTSKPLTFEKSGWKGWAQVELFYYALGVGYDVSFERSGSVTETTKDLTAEISGEDDEEKVVLCTAETRQQGDAPRDFQRYAEDCIRDWFQTFEKLPRE